MQNFSVAPGQTTSAQILISSAGRRVELLRAFREAGQELGIPVRLLACDLRPELSSACHDADQAFKVPRVDDPAYVDALIAICRDHQVSLVVPTIDTELMALSRARDRFRDLGVEIAISDRPLIDIASDKLATAAFFQSCGLPTPRSEPIEAVLADPDSWTWPVFVKARYGSAGRAAQMVQTPTQLAALTANEPLIVQTLLKGQEYTVNMFFDLDGRMRCAIPHLRIQTRAGEVEKGVTRKVDSLDRIAEVLAAALPGPRGALCFQAMVDAEGNASLIEINARFGGGYPLAHRAGAKFARWLVEERLALPSSISNDWQQNLMMLRWDATVFAQYEG